MATLFIVRHGHIEKNGRFIGQTDLPLSVQGHEQAVRLGRIVSHVGFDACFVSPLTRALETARHILAENNVMDQRTEGEADKGQSAPFAENTTKDIEWSNINVLPALQEISLGLWEGKTKAEIMTAYPLLWEERGARPATTAPPEGESYAMLYGRLGSVFQILSSFKGEENVLVVAHRSVGQVLMGHYSRFSFETWPHLDLPYGSVTLCPLLA